MNLQHQISWFLFMRTKLNLFFPILPFGNFACAPIHTHKFSNSEHNKALNSCYLIFRVEMSQSIFEFLMLESKS